MIHVRSKADIEKIRSACSIAVSAMTTARDMIKPGITTIDIADEVKKTIESHDAKAAFLGYYGFPGAICVSINNEVVHGIPGSRIIEEGDIIKVDIGTYIYGFYGDMTRTFTLGAISEKVTDLVESTEESLYIGISQAVAGKRVGDIGHAIQEYVESKGYSVVRALVGHGIGRHLHEDPQVPNFGKPGTGPLLKNGMVLAVEPMVNDGVWNVKTLDNGWTVVTEDGGMSAHFENTCVVRDGKPDILTLMDGEEKWLKTIQ